MKKNLTILILILLGLFSLFWWYEIRPSKIRSNCIEKVTTLYSGNDKENYNFLYETCIRKAGLNK